MADNTNSIDIVLQDKVDAGIAPKIVAIRDAAKDASPAVGALAAELDRLKSLGALSSLMDGVGRSTSSLSTATTAHARAQRASATAVAENTAALKAQTQTATTAAAAQSALAEAATAQAAAMADEIAIQEAVNAGIAEFESLLADAIAEQAAYNDVIADSVAAYELRQAAVAATIEQESLWGSTLEESSAALEGQGVIWQAAFNQETVATNEQTAAMVELTAATDAFMASQEGLLTANTAATAETTGRALATNNLTFALLGDTAATEANGAATVSANVSAAASLGLLEGRTLSMNRAAANFLTKILPFGEILQAAFPIIGAVALISVVYQAYEAFDKLETKIKQFPSVVASAWQKATDSIINSNISTQTEIDRMQGQIDKLEHRPAENGLVLAFDDARESAARLGVELDKETDKVDSLLNKSKQSFSQKLIGDSGTDDISKQLSGFNDRVKSVKAEYDQVYQDIGSDSSKSTADKTRNIADVRQAEMAALEKVYSDADAYITPKLRDLRGKLDDFNDPLRKATGTAGSDPSGQIALLRGASSFFDADQQNIGEQFLKDTTKSKLDGLKGQLSEQKNAAKEAAAEWKALEAAFVSYELKISESGKKPTPQQDLAFLRQYDDTINPLNRTKLQSKELPFQNAIDSQTFGQDQIAKLSEQASRLNEYGTVLKETTELDRIMQEAQKKGIVLDDDTVVKLTLLSEAIRVETPLQEAKSKVMKDATATEDQYNLTLKAAQAVMADHPELTAAITTELNKLKIAHDDVLDPMAEFNRGLTQEIALMGQYGEQLEVSHKVQELANQLRAKGVTNYQEWAEAQRGSIQLTIEAESLQQAENTQYEATVGVLDKLTTQRLALTAATRQELSVEAQRSALLKNSNEINDQQLKTQGIGGENGAGVKGVFGGAIASYASNFTTVAAGIKNTLQTTFATLADGFADSIGRAIVYAKNLGSALKDVARSALSELISGLVKLGIQMAVLALAKKLFGNTDDQTAQSTAQATTTATAWAPAAALVSLATFGANLAPAVEALGITAAVAEGLSALSTVGGHATGGWIDGIGSGTSDSNLRWLSDGEYVVRASAAAQNAGLLEAINSGKPVQGAGSQPFLVAGGSSKPMNVQIHNYAGVGIQTQQIDESTIRIIARDEADKSVHANADTATANAVANPNSRTAKAMRNYTTAARRRAS